MGRISLDLFRRKSHDENSERELPGYLKAMHDVPTRDSKRDLGLLVNHKKDRLSMDEAREKVPVAANKTETETAKTTENASSVSSRREETLAAVRKSAELERQDSAAVRKVQVL